MNKMIKVILVMCISALFMGPSSTTFKSGSGGKYNLSPSQAERLQKAVQQGDQEEIQRIMKEIGADNQTGGVDSFYTDPVQSRQMDEARKRGDRDKIQRIISESRMAEKGPETELAEAIKRADAPEIKRLLGAGADPNKRIRGVIFKKDLDDKSLKKDALFYFPLFALVLSEKLTLQQKLSLIPEFRKAGADFNIMEYRKRMVLGAVLDERVPVDGRVELAGALLESGADPNNRYNTDTTYLNTVAFAKYAEKPGLVRLLLAHKADPNEKSSSGYAPLHCIIPTFRTEKKLDDIVHMLLDARADPNLKDKFGETPLFRAAKGGNVDICHTLISVGARFDADKYLALEIVPRIVSSGFCGNSAERIEVLDFFLDRGLFIDEQDRDGNTAAWYASGNCASNEVLDRLVERGADINIYNAAGVTPAANARKNDCAKNYELLVRKGGAVAANRNLAPVSSPACRAVTEKKIEALQSIPAAEFGRITGRTDMGVPATPLHLAVERGDMDVLKMLARRRVDWNVPDFYGRSPLHLAVLSGRRDIALFLLKAGADPNDEDIAGETPLSYSIAVNPEIAGLIIDRGVDRVSKSAIRSAVTVGDDRLDILKRILPKGDTDEDTLRTAYQYCNVAVTEFLADKLRDGKMSPSDAVAEAKKNRDSRLAEVAKRHDRKKVERKNGGIAGKRGRFIHTIEEWSPYCDWSIDKDLKKYPVSVYVPESYTGGKPYGLMVFLYGGRPSHSYPRADYIKTLDNHEIIWVGFSAYNGVGGDYDNNHEVFVLAAVYAIQRYYSIDPGRIYMGGLSWGGRLTGRIVLNRPDIFSGGIGMGGCFSTSMWGIIDSRDRVRLVLSAGDYDFNRNEAYKYQSAFIAAGVRGVYFMQEPYRGHEVLSGPYFERAMRLIDGENR